MVHMQAYSAPVHTASVNGVAFAPHELGLMLATASSDGSLSVLTYRQAEGGWFPQKVSSLFGSRSIWCCMGGVGITSL